MKKNLKVFTIIIFIILAISIPSYIFITNLNLNTDLKEPQPTIKDSVEEVEEVKYKEATVLASGCIPNNLKKQKN